MYYAKLAALAEKALIHGAIGIVFVAWLLVAPAVQAQVPDAAEIAEGMRLFLQKGNCQACHGWAADGRKMDSQMPDGANLGETKLEPGALIVATKWGRPGRAFPSFDRLAYSDARCYGMKQADLKSRGLGMTDPPATLQAREGERPPRSPFPRN